MKTLRTRQSICLLESHRAAEIKKEHLRWAYQNRVDSQNFPSKRMEAMTTRSNLRYAMTLMWNLARRWPRRSKESEILVYYQRVRELSEVGRNSINLGVQRNSRIASFKTVVQMRKRRCESVPKRWTNSLCFLISICPRLTQVAVYFSKTTSIRPLWRKSYA